MKPDSLQNIDTSLVDLLEFLHSPREYATDSTSTADTPFVLIINGKVFLATNKTEVKTLYQIAKNEGVDHPTVQPLGTDPSAAQRVGAGDADVLNRLVADKQLTQGLHMVIVKEML